MTHLSSINALASDIAKLSKTLTTLATEIESALTQEDATEAAAAPKQTAKKAAQTKEVPKKDFQKMGYMERTKLFQENPTLYNALNK